jgi:K+-transporting ATPase ATPase A chain
MSTWVIPILFTATAVLLSIPAGLYLAWIMDGRYHAPAWLAWLEKRFALGGGSSEQGPKRSWKSYVFALLLFNTLMFVFSYLVLALQPKLPLNPDEKGMLAPSTIFNSAASFITNTNLQHYSGEQHFSYFSQIAFVVWNMFISAAVGICALCAMIRGLRGDRDLGNFYLDMWRAVMYVLLPTSLITGVLLMAGGVPMTFEGIEAAKTVEKESLGQNDKGEENPQKVSRGPAAVILPIKHLGTNGGGFFGANSAHPFENPDSWTNYLECVSIMLFPLGCVVMFGRMLGKMRQAVMIYGVALVLFGALLGWAVHQEDKPNPALLAQPARSRNPSLIETSALPPLPVDQRAEGNLEGKELRYGPGAAPTFVTVTTTIMCGSVNCMHDSLNPLTGLTPLSGMWLNNVFGGKGVGLINMLVYLILAVFLSGLMVGRTPEYLGKKVEAREMKLAMLALLVHPFLILMPTGAVAASDMGKKLMTNPAAHGFSQVLYELSSCSANNGSGFEGMNDTYGFNNLKDPGSQLVPWDILTALVMLFGRFIPIVAPIALAGSLAAKKPTPFTAGTMRTDTMTFGVVLLGTILLVGALLFMPAAVLGPVAEQLGPLPFGR